MSDAPEVKATEDGKSDAGVEQPAKPLRGFAAIAARDPERVRELGRMGGERSRGMGYRFTSETAREAGRKGAAAAGAHRFTSETAREAGRKGAEARTANRLRRKEQSGEP